MKSNSREFIDFVNRSVPLESLRKAVLMLLVLLVDVFMLIIIIGDPYQELYRNLLVPPILMLHVYALWIVVSPVKRQIASRLYIGVFSAFVSIGYLVLIQKILYGMMEVTSPLYLIVTFVGWLIATLWMVRFIVRKVQRDSFGAGNPQSMGIYGGAACLGVFVGHAVLGYSNGNFKMGMLAALLYTLSLLMMFLAVVMIYRYMLIRRHPELFVAQQMSRSK